MNILFYIAIPLLFIFISLIAKTEINKQVFKRRLQSILDVPQQKSSTLIKLRAVAEYVANICEQRFIQEKDKKQLRTLLLSAGFFSSKNVAWFLLIKYSLMLLIVIAFVMTYMIDENLVFEKNSISLFALFPVFHWLP